MNANERSKRLTLRIYPTPTSIIDKNEDNAITEVEFQELYNMQQAFKSIKIRIFCTKGMKLSG